MSLVNSFSSPQNYSFASDRSSQFTNGSGFHFGNNPLFGSGRAGNSPSMNVMAYRPKNVNVVHLPAGLGQVIMDPSQTSVPKMKSILNVLDRYEKMMMQQCEKKMAQQLSGEISGQGGKDKKDPINQMIAKYTENIMSHQGKALGDVLRKNPVAAF